ncbi:hypothetical protein LTR29_017838 [Friedmanniomyces endolithicus]|nr:hypothetical protein LTR29_017838 [Friedmanniomyces endolithicus]
MSDRHPLQPTTSTSATAPEEDLSWLQFLRTAGGTVPERTDSADRKRRHTGLEHQGRSSYPYPTSAAYSSAILAAPPRRTSAMSGSNPATAIDLTSPSPPRPRPLPSPHNSATIATTQPSIRRPSNLSIPRRESEIRLPTWQADHEATQCPVCKVDFGFWNRRHHCRKCGRVVCATCSPHRITIPRQYIVQPPSNVFPGEDHGTEGMEAWRTVMGGEVVRVCNPCVPDPWRPDNANVRGGGGEEVTRPRPLIEGARNAGEAVADERRRHMAAPSPFFPPPPGGRYRSQSYQPAATAVPAHSALGQRAALPTAISQDRFIRQGLPPPHQSRAISHRYSHSHNPTNASVPLPAPPIFPPGTRPTISTTPSAPTRPRPIHEVREEDECPVCGAEFPSGDVLAREAHIQDCIAARFSSTPSSSSMPRPPPQQPQHPPPDQQAAPQPSSIATGSTPPTTAALLRPRAQSAFRPRGMALYTATEKDCLDSSGETQECVICFEEFQPGDELGRMECLCKFHRGCIRGWWDVQAQRGRGRGGCPTHVHYD